MPRVPLWGLVSSLAAPVLLIGGWTVAATVQPVPFDSVVRTISDLAARDTPHRWLMTSALVGVGLSHLATASALRLGGAGRATGSWAGRAGDAAGGRFPAADCRRFLMGAHRRSGGSPRLARGVAGICVDAPAGAPEQGGRPLWTAGERGGDRHASAGPSVVPRRAVRGWPEGGVGRTCCCRSAGQCGRWPWCCQPNGASPSNVATDLAQPGTMIRSSAIRAQQVSPVLAAQQLGLPR